MSKCTLVDDTMTTTRENYTLKLLNKKFVRLWCCINNVEFAYNFDHGVFETNGE